ncbi:hypothetical protein, partial [Pseudomonas veronii]|uniref:hypothetical protein n=1 Tax=Pseudomonas veronii TaxID=76761 RepID=UPI0021BE88D6
IGKPLYGGIQSLRWFLVPLLPKPLIVLQLLILRFQLGNARLKQLGGFLGMGHVVGVPSVHFVSCGLMNEVTFSWRAF